MQWSCRVCHLALAQTSRTDLNNWYQWFLKVITLVVHTSISTLFIWRMIRTYLTISWNFQIAIIRLNIWVMIFVRKTNYIKLMNWAIRFKKDQLRKGIIKVPVANRNFFAVFWLGPGLSSISPHNKSKLHVNHR